MSGQTPRTFIPLLSLLLLPSLAVCLTTPHAAVVTASFFRDARFAGKYDEIGSKSAGHGGGGDRDGDANIAMLEKEHEEITKVHTGDAVVCQLYPTG